MNVPVLFSDQSKMDDENSPTNDIVNQHISELNDENKTNDDIETTQKDGVATKKNQKCQDSAKNHENVRAEQKNDSPKNDSEENPQEQFSLDALESTKNAVAQFAAAALSKGPNESSVKDLTMLQTALFTLQHQQVFQMQLIEQLQYQLAKTNAKKDKQRTISQTKSKSDDQIDSEQEITVGEIQLTTPSNEW